MQKLLRTSKVERDIQDKGFNGIEENLKWWNVCIRVVFFFVSSVCSCLHIQILHHIRFQSTERERVCGECILCRPRLVVCCLFFPHPCLLDTLKPLQCSKMNICRFIVFRVVVQTDVSYEFERCLPNKIPLCITYRIKCYVLYKQRQRERAYGVGADISVVLFSCSYMA